MKGEKNLILRNGNDYASLTVEIEPTKPGVFTGKGTFSLASTALDIGKDVTIDHGNNPETWFDIPFRLLSAVLIEGHWIEIPKKVLKAAVKKFDMTLYMNHHDVVNEWLGKIEQPTWDNSEPPGVNGLVRVNALRDEKLGGDIILGLKSKALGHMSVGFWYLWHPSHMFEDMTQFFRLLGTEHEGEIVRMILDEITDVGEGSIVSYGADRNAVPLGTLALGDEGEIVIDSEEEETEKNEKESLNKEVKMYLKLLNAVLSSLGMEGVKEDGETTIDFEAIRAIKASADAHSAKIAELRVAAETNIALLETAGKKVDPEMKAAIVSCDPAVLKIFAEQLAKRVVAEIPTNGRSSEPGDDGLEKPEPVSESEKSFTAINV